MFRIIAHRGLVEPHAEVTGVRVAGGIATATLRIDGLLCSACAGNVRDRLERVEGVRSAEVDLAAGDAVVSLDPDVVEPRQLIDAVDQAVVLRPSGGS